MLLGNAGDSLSNQRGMSFSTFDQDNDRNSSTNCANLYKSGWWFFNCNYGNLNGQYSSGTHFSPYAGITWGQVANSNSFEFSEMQIRPR